MARGDHGFVVCLYGPLDTPNSASPVVAGYRQYLNAAAEYIARHSSRHKIVVLAGGLCENGHTSAARSVRDYFAEELNRQFKKRGHITPDILIDLEETSLNAVQKISFGSTRLICQHRVATVTIIVDRPRRYTARIIAMHPKAMPPIKFEWDIVSFRRFDDNLHSMPVYQFRKAFRFFLNSKRIERDLKERMPVFK